MPLNEQARADLSKKRGEAAAKLPQGQKKDFIRAQGDEDQTTRNHMGDVTFERLNREADHVNRPSPSLWDKVPSSPSQTDPGTRADMDRKMPMFKHGTDRVKKTGPAIIHKDEAVLRKSDADKYRAAKSVYGGLSEILGGDKESKPDKEIKEIRTRKAKSGGYIHEHHHTHPEHHPMEEHTSENQDAMVSHMMEHLGTPNPGEQEADEGQNGIEGMNGNVGQ